MRSSHSIYSIASMQLGNDLPHQRPRPWGTGRPDPTQVQLEELLAVSSEQ